MSGTTLTLSPKGNTQIVTAVCRLSHPTLMTPRGIRSDPNSLPKFGASLIFDPPDTVDIWNAMVLVANAAFPPTRLADGTTINGEGLLRNGTLHSPLRDGKERPTDPAYVGKFFINASSPAQSQPQFVDYDGVTPIPGTQFYAGCYVRAFIGIFHFNKGVNKGLGVGLNALQWVEQGARIDGKGDAKAAFAQAGALAPRPQEPGYGYNGGAPLPQGGGMPPPSWQGQGGQPQAPQNPAYASPQQPQYQPPGQQPQYQPPMPQQQYQPPGQPQYQPPMPQQQYQPPLPQQRGGVLPPGVG